eukprot:gene32809-biopygen14018
MFSITVPNVDLPADLGFTQDFDLKLAIGDDGAVVVCGRHWTLFTTVTQPMADFEAAYGSLQQTAMVSCAAAAAAEPPPLDIDDSCMPFDKLTYAVVVALEELVDNSCCPNTRVFAWLYAKHLRAADMAFTDLLQTPAIANMAATALDAWFVRHPMFRAQAHEAQDLLITVLDDYTPSRPRIDFLCNGKKSLQPLMWDMLAAGGNESCKELLNTFRVAYATGLIDYIRQMCGDDVCNPKQVGTVNVNYSSDIDVNLNFNGEILHYDLDRIVLIFKSINDYHYQRFKRNFTDMFDINIYGSHFGMLNNPKNAKSKEEIDLISNDPQQRLFAMGKLAIMCKWSDREDMLKATDFIKKQPTYNSNNNEKLYTSYLKKYFAIDRNNTTTTTSRTGAVSGIVKVGRIFSMTKLLENDVYWSVGAFLHIVSGRKDLTESMYVDSMLDNTGFIVSNLRKKHVCKKEVSPYTTVLRVAKYMERVLDAYMLCRHVKSEAHLQKLLTMCSKLNIERKRNTGRGMFSTAVTPKMVQKELAKIPPGDLINRMNIINTNQLIKKTSTLEEQDAITKLVQTIETATKQKEDFDKATRDFYTVYEKLKLAIMDTCDTGPRLCGVVNGAINTPKKNS